MAHKRRYTHIKIDEGTKTHTHTHIHACIFMHTYAHTSQHTWTHARIHPYTRAYITAHITTFIHTSIPTHLHPEKTSKHTHTYNNTPQIGDANRKQHQETTKQNTATEPTTNTCSKRGGKGERRDSIRERNMHERGPQQAHRTGDSD